MKTDMTKGNPMKIILLFSIPVLMGNLFQQFYNMVDTIIVGQYLGSKALAAVGSTGCIMFLVLGFANGIAQGFGVMASHAFGAKKEKLLKHYVALAIILTVIVSVVLTIPTVLASRQLLIWLNTPDDILVMADAYIKVIFAGIFCTMSYNVASGLLRSIGDSKTPLYFLVTSAFLNIFGDLFFVVVLRWGVAGSAIATVCSEGLCCLLCGIYIKKKIPLLCLGKKWWVFDKSLLGKTVSYGSTSAMQQVCLQLGKLIIQSVVNTQGVAVMAAFTAVNRVDDFAYTPQQNIGHAMTTFLAQNKGAGHKERMKKGFQTGLLIELVYSIGLFCVIWGLAPQIMTLFAEDGDAQVVSLGISYLHLISWMYILPGLTNGVQGFFRGIGDLKVTLYSTFMNMFGRVVAVFVMIRLLQMEFASLAWANMVGWIVMLLFEVPLLVKSMRNGECG